VTTAPLRQSRLSAQIAGRYELDLSGRLALRKRTAKAEVAASQANLLGLRRWLTSEVVRTYLALHHVEQDTASALIEQALLPQPQAD